MKRYRVLSAGILAGLFALALSPTAFADSSWVWISETRPYDVLPWVAIATLVIETGMIWLICKFEKPFKIFCVVTLGNLLSFAAPYVAAYFTRAWYTFTQMMEHLPSYTVGFVFLAVTLLIELPVEYHLLKNDCPADSLRRFLYTIIAANVLTTVMVAVVERTICKGHW